MSLHKNAFNDNNSYHESNSEFIGNSTYENVPNTTASDYEQESISTFNVQYHKAPLQQDEHDFVPTPHDYDNASAKVSIPKISTRIDSSQNQVLKIELEIVIKLQNDQAQQRTQYVRSSTLPKNRIVNRMSPYRKSNEQNIRNKSSDHNAQTYPFVKVPQLNRSPAVYMQNVDNNYISQSQFQPDDNLNESFRSNYTNY